MVMELYHCSDARSFRCLWQMEEMSLPYKLHVLTFPPGSSDSFMALNPLGTVPLLVDGKVKLTESAAILEYLATRHGPTSLRVEPDEEDYGAWLNWLHFGEATLTTPQTVSMNYGVFQPEEKRELMIAESYREIFLRRLEAVEAALADSAYLCARRFTSADISVAYALLLSRFHGAEPRLPDIVRDYWLRLQQRPGYKAARLAQKARAA